MIYVVEAPKPPPPPKPPSLFEGHPLPWKIGECNETRADIYDANGLLVVSLRRGFSGNPLFAHELAERLIALMSAIGQLIAPRA